MLCIYYNLPPKDTPASDNLIYLIFPNTPNTTNNLEYLITHILPQIPLPYIPYITSYTSYNLIYFLGPLTSYCLINNLILPITVQRHTGLRQPHIPCNLRYKLINIIKPDTHIDYEFGASRLETNVAPHITSNPHITTSHIYLI